VTKECSLEPPPPTIQEYEPEPEPEPEPEGGYDPFYEGTYDAEGRQMEADPNDEWVSYFDKDSNSLYYFNNYTGESAWELPEGCKLAYE